MKSNILTHTVSSAAVIAALVSLGIASPAHATGFSITDLVTNDNANLTALGLPAAANQDDHLVNPWGISFTPTSPFWTSDNATGVSTLYTAAGAKAGGPLVVTVAPPAGAPAGFVSSPTGTVFNNVNTDFIVTNPKTGVS